MHSIYLIWKTGHIPYLHYFAVSATFFKFFILPSAPTNEVQDQMLGTEWSMAAQSGNTWLGFKYLFQFVNIDKMIRNKCNMEIYN